MITLFEANLFSSANVGDNLQLATLKTEIDGVRSIPSESNSNDKCWRSSYQYKNINWLISELQLKIDEAVEFYSKDIVFLKNFKKNKFEIFYWTNINAPLSRNVLHSHKNSIFSAVYYIQGTGTGSLRLINPANTLGDCNRLSPFTRDFYFNPKDRDLILWPAWVPHEVEINESTRERINIVFDIKLKDS